MAMPRMIAIDGPAASGKSTVAERVANEIGYIFFDTGVMYRAVTWAALARLQGVQDEAEVSALAEQVDIDIQAASLSDGRKCDVLLDGTDITWEIRRQDVEANVSVVAAYPQVRKAMTAIQRKIGMRGGIVMVGRDIGTVVLPEAELKIYLDASVEERARRRCAELQQRGQSVSLDEILAAMRERDRIDSTRAVAPLRPAEDAIQLCTDGLDIEQVVEKVLGYVKKSS